MNRCKHDGCHCEPQGDGYCSDMCRNGVTSEGHCGCRHEQCR